MQKQGAAVIAVAHRIELIDNLVDVLVASSEQLGIGWLVAERIRNRRVAEVSLGFMLTPNPSDACGKRLKIRSLFAESKILKPPQLRSKFGLFGNEWKNNFPQDARGHPFTEA